MLANCLIAASSSIDTETRSAGAPMALTRVGFSDDCNRFNSPPEVSRAPTFHHPTILIIGGPTGKGTNDPELRTNEPTSSEVANFADITHRNDRADSEGSMYCSHRHGLSPDLYLPRA
jgi:hypothetical protein